MDINESCKESYVKIYQSCEQSHHNSPVWSWLFSSNITPWSVSSLIHALVNNLSNFFFLHLIKEQHHRRFCPFLDTYIHTMLWTKWLPVVTYTTALHFFFHVRNFPAEKNATKCWHWRLLPQTSNKRLLVENSEWAVARITWSEEPGDLLETWDLHLHYCQSCSYRKRIQIWK